MNLAQECQSFVTSPTGGPEWNRTTTYGFGGHRPIHWTTGPGQVRWRGRGNEQRENWQEKDFGFSPRSMPDAIPSGPESGGLRGVWDDLQQEGFVSGFELIEVVHGADANVVHIP
jgi:hypothetical protein